MPKRERVMVYPFDVEFAPILRHQAMLGNYDIVSLSSPNGWGLCGKDAGIADCGEPIGIDIHSDFDLLLDNCDTVIFSESHIPVNPAKILYPKISMSIEKHKNILCTANIDIELYDSIVEKCDKQGVYFKYYNNRNSCILDECEDEDIYKINTPIIFVIGMGERTNKFQIQLSLRKYFMQMGYKISQIGSRSYCEMLGFHSMPAFMYSNAIKDYKKIILFNHYVKSIEMSEKPDAIIIGIPGGVIPFNDKFTNRFGMTAFQISMAVKPDTAVMSVFYEKYQDKYFKELHTMIKYRFATEIDCYSLSNVKFDWGNSKQNGMMSYVTIDSKMINEKKKSFSFFNCPVFNMLNSEDAERTGEYLMNRLQNYSDVESI
ncbi:peptide maturation system protein (TIGR04066 family) [Anaerobacterium chartisolvens]|uniref:Peptide maturation system protein (TIGR04066 family) n=1 Tax=Anaerobacterium chartisolvens TaxID=1297424 RepID=A0A369B4E3_9FIRM|nr:TIGR04066 family peptide maturation system protein [Anaerobacterium chartisolvens]RCX15468.1 peptide maturation system protein (TIGR04066 family) [Anaerobacterium chartisolvens]